MSRLSSASSTTNIFAIVRISSTALWSSSLLLPYGLDSVCGLLLVVALAPRDLSARGGHVFTSRGGRHGRRVLLIAFRAQGGSAGRNEACEISALTLVSGL